MLSFGRQALISFCRVRGNHNGLEHLSLLKFPILPTSVQKIGISVGMIEDISDKMNKTLIFLPE